MVLIKGLSLKWPKHLSVWVCPWAPKLARTQALAQAPAAVCRSKRERDKKPGSPFITKSQVQSNRQMLVRSHKREAIVNLLQ